MQDSLVASLSDRRCSGIADHRLVDAVASGDLAAAEASGAWGAGNHQALAWLSPAGVAWRPAASSFVNRGCFAPGWGEPCSWTPGRIVAHGVTLLCRPAGASDRRAVSALRARSPGVSRSADPAAASVSRAALVFIHADLIGPGLALRRSSPSSAGPRRRDAAGSAFRCCCSSLPCAPPMMALFARARFRQQQDRVVPQCADAGLVSRTCRAME